MFDKRRKWQSKVEMSKVVAMVLAGSGLDIDDLKSKKLAEKIAKQELENMQDHKVNINKKRFNKMTFLGLGVQMSLSPGAQNRECCEPKRLQINENSRNIQIYRKALWDYQKEFNNIKDDKLDQEIPTNPLINE